MKQPKSKGDAEEVITTIYLPEKRHEDVRMLALMRGQTLKDLLNELIEGAISKSPFMDALRKAERDKAA